ncbi:hypothetical protein U4E84_08215 [Halorubrum sp. AD140]|uniref:DUF7260 family protein n=1 Tax=Halorubrum sp. AD140 TaxID=3050073 RepID=UPI002ACD19B1|nr:hypothetical protein [Halorubrum sp. AD140]MDZ5811331.1 hypothetical protein [Halorubrum sp. AD140]
MSAHSGSATAFRIPSSDPTAAECTTLSCEIGAVATEPGAITAAIIAALAVFLTFAYVRDATEAGRRERRRVLDERDAFEEFADRVDALDPAPTGGTAPAFDGSMAAVRTVGGGGDDVRLRRVLAAYRDTVMSLPHYREEYDETIPESLAAELGPDTATALASNGTLSAGAQTALVRRGRRAAEARSSLADAIGAELDALTRFENDLTGVDRRRRRLLEHLDGVTGNGTDAALDVWERLDELERECDAIAADRQRSLDDPPMAPDPTIGVDDGRAFYEYLYGPTDGPRYPVLAEVSELAERIRTDRDRVASRLANGR